MQLIGDQHRLRRFTPDNILTFSAACLGAIVAAACASTQHGARWQLDRDEGRTCLGVHFVSPSSAKRWGNYDDAVVVLDAIPEARIALEFDSVSRSHHFRARIFRGHTVGVGTWQKPGVDTLLVVFRSGLTLRLNTSTLPFTGRAAFRSDYHLASEAPEADLSARTVSCEGTTG